MPAPNRPNTAAATAAVRRRGDETAARRLRAAGWLVLPPEYADSDLAGERGQAVKAWLLAYRASA
jgi:hypothetical protein